MILRMFALEDVRGDGRNGVEPVGICTGRWHFRVLIGEKRTRVDTKFGKRPCDGLDCVKSQTGELESAMLDPSLQAQLGLVCNDPRVASPPAEKREEGNNGRPFSTGDNGRGDFVKRVVSYVNYQFNNEDLAAKFVEITGPNLAKIVILWLGSVERTKEFPSAQNFLRLLENHPTVADKPDYHWREETLQWLGWNGVRAPYIVKDGKPRTLYPKALEKVLQGAIFFLKQTGSWPRFPKRQRAATA